jgi:heat shock protein HtpX
VNALCIFGEKRGLARLFATHPPVEKRIERLRG